MRAVMNCVVLGLMVSVLAPVASAQEAKGKKKGGANAVVEQTFAIPKEITLSDDQKAKVEAIKKEHSPKLTELAKKMNEGVTDEQRKAQREAQAKAKTDGKKGKQVQEEIEKAMNLTDEQKKVRAEIQPQLQKLQLSIKEQIHALLTDDQKAHYKLPKARKNK